MIASEKYDLANKVAREVQQITVPRKLELIDKIDSIAVHKILGYPLMFAVMLSLFFAIFTFGDFFSEQLGVFFEQVKPIIEVQLEVAFSFN